MFNKVDTLRSSGKNSAKSSLYEIRSINTKKSQQIIKTSVKANTKKS